MKADLKPKLQKMISEIETKNTYYGNKISASVMDLIYVEEREDGAGVVAPFWLSVLQKGRGPRKNEKDHQLWKKIYAWMDKRGMFKSKSAQGKISEAKSLTWYINKHGNEQFRNKVFVEIYNIARANCEKAVMAEYGLAVTKLTENII